MKILLVLSNNVRYVLWHLSHIQARYKSFLRERERERILLQIVLLFKPQVLLLWYARLRMLHQTVHVIIAVWN